MGLLKGERGGRRGIFCCVFICLMFRLAAGNVILIGKNVSLSFDDIEANFAPRIKASGECGVLYKAEPLDACTPLTNKVVKDPYSPFVLIKRGGCTFDDKLSAAQHAGFKAAIVYNNEDSSTLVSMSGTLGGITIHAVFVAKSSGEILKKYTGRTDVEFWIIPTYENSAWSIMAISFISLVAISSVLATCFFVCRHRIRRERPRAPNIRDFHGMSRRLVKKMPSLIFTSVLEDNCTSRTCAICLEDYDVGEKLRVLPCHHKFHASCVDAWLTIWRTFCPMCKRDANTSTSDPPASESTPLLSSAASSLSSSTASLSSFHSFLRASPSSSAAEALLSFRSSLAVSPSRAIPISPMMMHRSSPLTSRTPSLSAASRLPPIPNPRRSYNNASLAIGISRSSLDLRNASSSHRSQLVSPHSLGYPLSSPMSSRYLTPFIPCSTNASPPSYLAGSSGRQSYLRHCTESGASLSAQDSALSLPGC